MNKSSNQNFSLKPNTTKNVDLYEKEKDMRAKINQKIDRLKKFVPSEITPQQSLIQMTNNRRVQAG
jgi:hypothetical protein